MHRLLTWMMLGLAANAFICILLYDVRPVVAIGSTALVAIGVILGWIARGQAEAGY